MDESLKDLNEFLLSNFSEDIISSVIEHNHLTITIVFSSLESKFSYIALFLCDYSFGIRIAILIKIHEYYIFIVIHTKNQRLNIK